MQCASAKHAKCIGADATFSLRRAARSDLSLPCPEVEYVACMIDSVSILLLSGRLARRKGCGVGSLGADMQCFRAGECRPEAGTSTRGGSEV
eukprot:2424248-Rhodomonas_salina.2